VKIVVKVMEDTPNIICQIEKDIPLSDLMALYEDAQWTAYTKDPEKLKKAVDQSLLVVTIRDNKTLVGLIRVVGDGVSIVYIQDILIKKSHQRKKLGTILVNKVLDRYKDVRQIVLLTDNKAKTINFYNSLGFKLGIDKGLSCFVKFRNLEI